MVKSKKVKNGQRKKFLEEVHGDSRLRPNKYKFVGSTKIFLVELKKYNAGNDDYKQYFYVVRAQNERKLEEILCREDMAFSGWEINKTLVISAIGKPEIIFQRGEK